MHYYEGIIDKSKGEKADSRNVQPEFLFHFKGPEFFGFRFKVLRIWEFALGHKKQNNGYGSGNDVYNRAYG